VCSVAGCIRLGLAPAATRMKDSISQGHQQFLGGDLPSAVHRRHTRRDHGRPTGLLLAGGVGRFRERP
jgi:hypothetical protein